MSATLQLADVNFAMNAEEGYQIGMTMFLRERCAGDSGVQSIISLYLVVMVLLSYFGRPFQ